MKTTTLFVLSLLLVASLPGFALDYTITFTGSGASTTVDSVIVQNLTKGTKVTVLAGNVLNLTVATAVEQVSSNDEFIRIYPNFVEGKSTVSFFAKQAGSTQINVISLDGKKIAGITENLQTGVNSFQLSLPNGSFVIQVIGNEYSYTTKMINQGAPLIKPEIVYIGSVKPTSSSSQKSKSSTLGTTTMSYTVGDQLLYKAVSGNYSTIVTDKPTESKTTNFGFVDCTDAAGNHYTIVTIGTQTWMASNLRVTHYSNGESITNLTVDADWAGATFAAWCDYSNTAANGTKYGHLYNWYAASDTRNIAPVGWHVPTDAEWTTLTTYLGGESVAGGKLKEAGTLNWASPNTAAINETGFSALPGGLRYSDGTFYYIGNDGAWWTAGESNASYAWYRYMSCSRSSVYRNYDGKADGFSVRCLRDN